MYEDEDWDDEDFTIDEDEDWALPVWPEQDEWEDEDDEDFDWPTR